MTCWALIPAKAPGEGKSRLASLLAPNERAALVARMLRHVVGVTRAAEGVACTYIVGPSAHDLAVPRIDDSGRDLNLALTHALAHAHAFGASRVIILPSDLPCLQSHEVTQLAVVSGDVILAAPDRHGTGTNALSLPLPKARAFGFAFGHDSFIAHHRAAKHLDLPFEKAAGAGLQHDIDVPVDLIDIVKLAACEV